MNRVWEWLKKWGWVLGSALAAGLAIAVGVGWAWRRARLGAIRDEVAVARASAQIEQLRALREELKSQVGDDDAAIVDIDQRLLENKRLIVEAHEGGSGMTDAQVLDAFQQLGY